MPIVNDIFMYDYKGFDHIKTQLLPGFFVNHMVHIAERDGYSYKNSDDYTLVKYMDEADKKGYDSGEVFEYRLNRDYFRNSHFQELSKNTHNVLAAGCSFTFGHGLPEEYTWPNIFKSMAKKDQKDINVINLGSPGVGISSVINNVMSFIHKYGKPDSIVALLPSISRDVVFYPKSKDYQTYYPSLSHLENKKKDPYYFFKTKNYIFEDSLYSAITQIRMFEQFCKNADIHLVWSTWLMSDLKIYDELEFEFFVSNQSFNFDPDGESEISGDYSKYSFCGRDNSHPGINYSTKTAHVFFETWKLANV